jgi:predicted DNA-binding transcriptional regulator AlpA
MTADVLEKPKRGLQCQPLEVVNIPDARLNIRTVEAVIGHKKTWIYDEMKESRFPRPDGHKRWLSDDIREYLKARREGRPWSPGERS